jgi:hypothetical protein
LIVALVAIVAALTLCLDGTRDGDLYLQLASGRFVAAHGIASVDPFRTIAHGDPWLNQQWLAELVVYELVRCIGVTGLTVVYAGLLAAPLALLLWLCRSKGAGMMAALAILYCPGLLTIVHPRAAVFTVLAFSLLVAIVVVGWLRRVPSPPSLRRSLWAVLPTLVVFALWANLHGGFVAGLLLIGLAVVGLALERRIGLPCVASARQVGLLAATGSLAVGLMLLATPLGTGLIAYLSSFSNPGISQASAEWRPAFQSPLAIVYVAVAATFAAWLWSRSPRPRGPIPALIVTAFLALALVSLRNAIFVGPVLALAIALLAPERPVRVPLPTVGLLLFAAGGLVAAWAVAVGPARNEPLLDSRLVGYALRHPPQHGHIATYAGIGSYMLWRSPKAPVELDGWLEHFTAAELQGTYAVLDGRIRDPMADVRSLRIGAVIVDRQRVIQALRSNGFEVAFRTPAGAYLVAP